MINVKLKYLSDKISRPEYATRGSAGFDLSAALDSSYSLKPGERAIIPTGVAVSIPKGYAGFLFSRAGLAAKKGVVLTNGAGVIDSDFTGEIKVPIMNISESAYTIKTGDRIAQLVVLPVEAAEFVIVDELPETTRGNRAFGSSGK